MPEQWKPIAGYIGLYEVSNTGKVRTATKRRNSPAGYVLKGGISPLGYHFVVLTKPKEKTGKHHFVHRLVAAAFIGEIPDGLDVDHIDHDKLNNRAENLRYITRSENVKRADVKNRATKLTDEQVREIRLNEDLSKMELAKQYGVSYGYIHRLRKGLMRNRVEVVVHPEIIEGGTIDPDAPIQLDLF